VGIYCPEDFKKFGHVNYYDDKYRCAGSGHGEQDDYDIFEHIAESFKYACTNSLSQFKDGKERTPLVSIPNGTYNVSDINHYLNFFPRRSFILTGIPVLGESMDYGSPSEIGLPIDLINKFFEHESLLINNITTLFPEPLWGERPFGLMEKILGWSSYGYLMQDPALPYMGISALTSCYFDVEKNFYKRLRTLNSHIGNIEDLKKMPRCLALKLPCLKTSRVEDFLELTQKYNKRFENMNNAISRVILTCENKSKIDDILIKEINSAIEDISSLYKDQMRILIFKGIPFVISISTTLVPIKPHTFLWLDQPFVKMLFGSPSIVSFGADMEKYFINRKKIVNNPYWLLGKMARMNKHRK